VPCANLKERRSARFVGLAESGLQTGTQFAGFVTTITAIAGKWHEQFSIHLIFTARESSGGKGAGDDVSAELKRQAAESASFLRALPVICFETLLHRRFPTVPGSGYTPVSAPHLRYDQNDGADLFYSNSMSA
jgi:predicted heme/steroid binding protein